MPPLEATAIPPRFRVAPSRSAGRVPSLTNRLAIRFNRFFFRPASPIDLGICRLLFFLTIILLYHPNKLMGWTKMPVLFWRPVWILAVLHLPLASVHRIHLFVTIWFIALSLAAIGLFTRWATWTAFVLGIYILGLQNSFGKVGHGEPILIFTMLILAMSRCGDAVSVDAWLERRNNPQRTRPNGEYTWPIRMVWMLMCIVFASAGATKLIRSGADWVNSDQLRILLLQHQGALKNPVTSIGYHLANHPALCRLLAGGSLGIELLFLLALFSRRLRRWIVPMGLVMQIGIGLAMGVYFTQFLACYLFWVPWRRLSHRMPVFHRGDLPAPLPNSGGPALADR